MDKHELGTPALLVDLDIMDRNIQKFSEFARCNGVRLRPHAKTPKVPAICHRLIAAGAKGVCLATLDEAWAMVVGGITDLLIPYPIVGERRVRELGRLMDYADVTVEVDTFEVAEALDQEMKRIGRTLGTCVKIDIGSRRFGLAPEPAGVIAFVQQLLKLENLRFEGLITFAGGLSHLAPSEIKNVGRREGETMVALAQALRGADIPVKEVSVGSTSTAQHAAQVPGVTEIRPGTFVFYDVTMLDRAVCAEEDCALTVLAMVVDRPTPDRVILDAGTKALTYARHKPEAGYGLVKGSGGLRLARVTEEHGLLEGHGLASQFRLGQTVEIIPNACGEALNLFNEIHAVHVDTVQVTWRIPATGYSQYAGRG